MRSYGIIGALLFCAAVVFGYFADFAGSEIIEIGLAAFGLCGVIIGAIKNGKSKNIKAWKTIAIICLAVAGGVLCAIGGLNENIFSELAGAVLALLAVIFGTLLKKSE